MQVAATSRRFALHSAKGNSFRCGTRPAPAQELDKLFDVTLIDRRDHMQHAIGQLRAAVVGGEFASSTLIPTDRVLKRGKVLKAAVTSISENRPAAAHRRGSGGGRCEC